MDPSKDQNLFYIAKEAIKAPLPHNWKKCENNGQKGFMNVMTKEFIIEHPLDHLYRKHYLEIKSMNLNKMDFDKENKNENAKNGKINENTEKCPEIAPKNVKEKNLNTNRKKQFEEKMKELENQRKNLENKKKSLLRKEEERNREKGNILSLEKKEMDKKFQQNLQEIHMRLMNEFNFKMKCFVVDFQTKFEQRKNDLIIQKINEQKAKILPLYEKALEKKIEEVEQIYFDRCAKYEEQIKENIDEIAMNEFQNEKFKVIQEKINEINEQRLNFEEDIRKKLKENEEKVKIIKIIKI